MYATISGNLGNCACLVERGVSALEVSQVAEEPERADSDESGRRDLASRETLILKLTGLEQQLLRFCRSITGNSTDAEDLRQDTLCQCLRKLDTYRGDRGLFSWVATIARHLWISSNRKNAHKFLLQHCCMRDEDDAQYEPEDVKCVNVSVQSETLDEIDQLSEALLTLTDDENLAVHLRIGEEMKLREIAESLQINIGKADRLVKRALEKLQDWFAKRDE